MNPVYSLSNRTLVPNTVVPTLRDAYDYSTVNPATSGTFYAGFNQTTGELRVRGGDFQLMGQSDDVFQIWYDGLDLNVSVNVSRDVAGTGALPGAGDLPAFVGVRAVPLLLHCGRGRCRRRPDLH